MRIESIKIPSSGVVEWDDEVIRRLSIFRLKDSRWKFHLWGQALIALPKKDFDYLVSRMQ
jgi:hypothetical protein